jgi:hypothetical protein
MGPIYRVRPYRSFIGTKDRPRQAGYAGLRRLRFSFFTQATFHASSVRHTLAIPVLWFFMRSRVRTEKVVSTFSEHAPWRDQKGPVAQVVRAHA